MPMGSFNEDKGLETLLEGVLGSTESFRPVAFMVADYNGVRDELKQFLECGVRSESDVWSEIARLCDLKVSCLEKGGAVIFPRVESVRFCVDINAGVIGSGSARRFSETEACVTGHVDGGGPEVVSLLLEHIESDARAEGYLSVFTLLEENDSFEAIYLKRGYLPSERKDDYALASCLGACVLYDRLLAKAL